MQSVEEEAPRAQAGMVLGIKKGKKGTATTEAPPPAKKKGADGSRRIKKEKKKVEEADPTNKTNMTPAPPQAHPIVQEWVLRALDFGVEKLREEFRGLAKYVRSDMTQNVFNSNHSTDINITKNRYQDVPCQDQCIVKLEPPSPSTYIHANYVGCPMYPEKRFICCQGP
ncbi:hypothetical protein L3Y34_000816 [Caenorhabditis briggsae]|uniref:Tyrosine-protein phosphatase domain-containing protein n=1 Tax=Caenorhabditis briggsae TaxID=6238 RepID=A0AAE9DAB9_CAEBR|nr:hypothetical protein L3Y34_000816 [Caenorhabditis briggsae]